VVVPPTYLRSRPATWEVLRDAPGARGGARVELALAGKTSTSSLMKLADCVAPASSTTTLMPFWHLSLASVPLPAIDPMMMTMGVVALVELSNADAPLLQPK
jgi:hypothetical protein